MVGALSGFIGFGFAFAVAGCLVLAFAWGLVGAPLRVPSHADTAAGVARSRAAMASTSASALILSLACFTRAATVSTLVVGRPLKVTPFPFVWILVGRGGFTGLAGVAGLVAAPTGARRLAFAWSTVFATAGVRSSRPAARSLASWSALTCRAMSSKRFGLAVGALDAASRPLLAFRRRDAGWLPLALPVGFLGALAGVAVVGVCRGLAMLGTPMPAYRAGLSYSRSCRRPRAANNPTCVSTLDFRCPSRCDYNGQAAGRRLVQAVVASNSTSASEGPGHSRARCGAGRQA